jgi:hypothetical protein
MTYEEKIAALFDDAGRLGISLTDAVPPLYRRLWAIGIKLPPPLLAGFWSTALCLAAYFGLSFTAFVLLFMGLAALISGPPLSSDEIFGILVVVPVLGGLPPGFVMAAQYWWLRRKFKLPRWKDYSGADAGHKHCP